MPGISKFETIVIGLGAMGSAAGYQLAKKGHKVLGIDQFSPPPHQMGSTHGNTRITRQAIGEGQEFVPISLRSYEIWDELEKKSGNNLLTITGGLILGNTAGSLLHGSSKFLQNTIDAAKEWNISHKVFSAAELHRRFPQFHIEDSYIGYYEEKAGFLRPELCIQTQIDLAKQYGAQINLNEKVHQFTPKNGAVEVRTDKGVYKARKLIVSAGPWISQFFPEFAQLFKVYRQVLYWFDIHGSVTKFLPENFPIFILVGNGKNGIYGFPAIDGPRGGIKVAFEEYSTDTTPEEVNREISKEEISRAYNKYIAKHLPTLKNKCIKAVTCLYTQTPDAKFIIDTHPEYPQIIIASPCSGHGFKHSAAIGEALSELAIDGKSHLNLDAFKIKSNSIKSD